MSVGADTPYCYRSLLRSTASLCVKSIGWRARSGQVKIWSTRHRRRWEGCWARYSLRAYCIHKEEKCCVALGEVFFFFLGRGERR